MQHSFANFLEKNYSTQKASVKSYIHNDQKVWLKKAAKRHATWMYLPLQWIAKFFGLEMLTPVPNRGGIAAVQCEIQRIQTLHELGIRTPEILATREDAFLMLDAAASGANVIQLEFALKNQQDSAQKMQLYKSAIEAIRDIHNKKAYLSEAFARNILVDEALNFSFIDFETDPGLVHSLESCFSRDWLSFIFSTARYFNTEEFHDVSNLLTQALKQERQSYQDVCLFSEKLSWILKFKPEKLGNDGERLKKCIYLLSNIRENPLSTSA